MENEIKIIVRCTRCGGNVEAWMPGVVDREATLTVAPCPRCTEEAQRVAIADKVRADPWAVLETVVEEIIREEILRDPGTNPWEIVEAIKDATTDIVREM
jgi:uncharacterized protein CbrC (UPF0167 family)